MFQGGFIWDYIDQSIYKKDRYGKEFQAYGGDFDDHPCDYNFSGNGIVYGGERDASPKMQEVKFCYQNIAVDVQKDKAVVKNKNLFVNTDAFALRGNSRKRRKETERSADGSFGGAAFGKNGGAADRGTDTSGRVCGDRFLPPERRYRMGQARP